MFRGLQLTVLNLLSEIKRSSTVAERRAHRATLAAEDPKYGACVARVGAADGSRLSTALGGKGVEVGGVVGAAVGPRDGRDGAGEAFNMGVDVGAQDGG